MENIDHVNVDNSPMAEAIKVVWVGESGVGKSCIINRFINDVYDPYSKSTLVPTFLSKNISIRAHNNETLKLEIWDTAGQEKFRSLNKLFYKDAAIAIFVYDITRKISFDELTNYWIKEVKRTAPDNIVFCIAANKSDLFEEEEVSEKIGQEFANENDATFNWTSALDADGIEEWFLNVGWKYLTAKEERLNPSKKVKKDKEHKKKSNKEVTGIKNELIKRDSIRINKKEHKEKKKKKKLCCF